MNPPSGRAPLHLALSLALASVASPALASDAPATGGKLLLTAGVSQVEGAAGGGLTPWAVIGGYGSEGQFGGSVFITRVDVGDYRLDTVGALVGIHDRVEFSIARQRFDTRRVGAALGLGEGFTLQQDIIGVKLRIAGDAVLDSDRAMPQIAIGIQHKRNDQGAVLDFIGAESDSGTDVYVSATKLMLAHGLLLNGTLRFTQHGEKYVKVGKNDEWVDVPFEDAPAEMHFEWKAFAEAIEQDIEPPTHGEYGRHIMEIIFAAEQSAITGGEVMLPSGQQWFHQESGKPVTIHQGWI